MAKDTLPECPTILKDYLSNQERLFQLLIRAETLLELILERDLAVYSTSKLHASLSMLSDFLQEVRRLMELLPFPHSLNALLKETPD
jgi:hypothetical protein